MAILLFDLDGTLTDPKLGLINCVKYALGRLGRPCPSAEVLMTFIGPALRPMFATLMATTDIHLIETAVDLYRERYADIGVYETRAYDGVQAMLTATASIASAAYVATSKPAVFAKRIIEHLGFERHFAGIYGAELDGTFDDKTELLRHLLKVKGIANASAIMIGDRAVDVTAAKSNGLRSIGTLWGYGSPVELLGAGADRLCATPQELSSCLSNW